MLFVWTIDGQEIEAFDFSLLSVLWGDQEAAARLSLRDVVLVCLFTNKRAAEGDEVPDESADRGGYWGDALARPGRELGSLLWTLGRSLANRETATRAADFCRDALARLVEDGIAREVRVASEVIRTPGDTPNGIGLTIEIAQENRPDRTFRFERLWRALAT